jgi:hypothetical protein
VPLEAALAPPLTCERRGLPRVADRLTDPEPFEAVPPSVALVEELVPDVLALFDPEPLDPEPPPGLFNSAEPRSAWLPCPGPP